MYVFFSITETNFVEKKKSTETRRLQSFTEKFDANPDFRRYSGKRWKSQRAYCTF